MMHMHIEREVQGGMIIISIAVMRYGPPGRDQWIIPGGSRLYQSVKRPLKGQNQWRVNCREPVVAVGVNPATLESAAEAGSGQFERV